MHAWHNGLNYDVLPVTTCRWILPFIDTGVVIIAILLSKIIDTSRNPGLFDYVNYGLAFFLLAVALLSAASLPMKFKGAAYAHYLGQKAQT